MEEWAAKSSAEILKYAEESAKAYERLQTTNQEIADQNKLNLGDTYGLATALREIK